MVIEKLLKALFVKNKGIENPQEHMIC
ncbi:hypothetical protein [Paradesulfitobacterium aromaticivorans]